MYHLTNESSAARNDTTNHLPTNNAPLPPLSLSSPGIPNLSPPPTPPISNLPLSSPPPSPPIPRSYKLREDKQEEIDEATGRFSPAKKRAVSPSPLDQDEESPGSSGRRKRKRELDILMEDKKVRVGFLFIFICYYFFFYFLVPVFVYFVFLFSHYLFDLWFSFFRSALV